jgi:glutaminase
MAKFGKYDSNGGIERPFDHCIKTGLPIRSGDGGVLVRIPGTPLFYQVSAAAWPTLTDADKTTLAQEAAAEWAAEAQE